MGVRISRAENTIALPAALENVCRNPNAFNAYFAITFVLYCLNTPCHSVAKYN